MKDVRGSCWELRPRTERWELRAKVETSRVLTWRSRWNVSQTDWIYSPYPSDNEPIENVQKIWNLIGKPYCYRIKSKPVRFLECVFIVLAQRGDIKHVSPPPGRRVKRKHFFPYRGPPSGPFFVLHLIKKPSTSEKRASGLIPSAAAVRLAVISSLVVSFCRFFFRAACSRVASPRRTGCWLVNQHQDKHNTFQLGQTVYVLSGIRR